VLTLIVASAAAGWLLGSIPVAYLLVRRVHGIDLVGAGSANVGANNAYRTTGSRTVGGAVLLLDAAKGAAAVMVGMGLAMWAGEPVAENAAWFIGTCALLAAIAGHNYNFFLSLGRRRMAGGKGLATAAGGFLLLSPWLVAVWLVLWIVGMLAFERWRGVRSSIPGNVLASALVPIAAWLLYGGTALVMTLLFAALVLPRHREQMRALLTEPVRP
jgi:acyl phosphate:glycerol-3-phosphate acyltransferase